MAEQKQQEPESTGRKPNRLGCGIAIVLCLIVYVLSYPWVLFSVVRLPSPAANTFGSALIVLYYPLESVRGVSETFDFCYRWYINYLYETFPDDFDFGLITRAESPVRRLGPTL